MNDIRSKFEEIWPVPDCIEWIDKSGEYVPNNYDYDIGWRFAYEWTGRLDTFTRCQETTALHLSLIAELLQEIESCHADLRSENWYVPRQSDLLDRAKQIMERAK